MSNRERCNITFVNLNTNTTVSLNQVPIDVNDNYNSSFSEQTPIGRSSPILFYSGGSSREISFNLDIHEDMITYTNNSGEKDIRVLANLIRAMSYPVIDGGFIKPPRVYMALGEQWKGIGHLNCAINWKKPFRNGRYVAATFTCTFVFMDSVSKSAYDIESGD